MQELQRAYQNHNQVKLVYVQLTDTARTVLNIEQADILDLDDKTATVYSHSDNSKHLCQIDRITDLTIQEQTSAYQESLF